MKNRKLVNIETLASDVRFCGRHELLAEYGWLLDSQKTLADFSCKYPERRCRFTFSDLTRSSWETIHEEGGDTASAKYVSTFNDPEMGVVADFTNNTGSYIELNNTYLDRQYRFTIGFAVKVPTRRYSCVLSTWRCFKKRC